MGADWRHPGPPLEVRLVGRNCIYVASGIDAPGFVQSARTCASAFSYKTHEDRVLRTLLHCGESVSRTMTSAVRPKSRDQTTGSAPSIDDGRSRLSPWLADEPSQLDSVSTHDSQWTGHLSSSIIVLASSSDACRSHLLLHYTTTIQSIIVKKNVQKIIIINVKNVKKTLNVTYVNN